MPKTPRGFPKPSRPAVTLAAAYGALFIGMGVHLPFFPLWLAQRNLAPIEIAIILALPLILRTVTLPIVTGLADRMGQLKWAVVVYSAASGAVCALYDVVDGFWPLAAVTAGAAVFWTALVPVIDALTASMARQGLDYGRVRLWGSITFMLAAAIGGVSIQAFGVGLVIPVIVISLGILALIGLVLPTVSGRAEPADRSLIQGASLLLKAPGVLLVLEGISLVQSSHAFFYAFGSVHLKVLGHSEGTIGVLWAASVVAEIIYFAASGALVVRFGLPALLVGAAGAAVLRWLAMMTDPGLAVTFIAQILHALTFAACHVATVLLIARSVPGHYAATAQGVFFALHGAINGTMMLSSGPLYTWLSGQGYAAMAGVALTGLALLLIGLPRLRLPQPQRAGTGG